MSGPGRTEAVDVGYDGRRLLLLAKHGLLHLLLVRLTPRADTVAHHPLVDDLSRHGSTRVTDLAQVLLQRLHLRRR